MKYDIPQFPSSPQRTPSSKPFFNPSERESFFSDTRQAANPFFPSKTGKSKPGNNSAKVSPVLRSKCRRCEQEGQLQRKANESEAVDDTAADPGKESMPEWFSDTVLQAIRSDEIGANNHLLGAGAEGQAVKLLQSTLLQWSEADLENPMGLLSEFGTDGYFGSETEKAVKSFQSAYQLDTDGLVGPVTVGELDAFLTQRRPMVTKINGPQQLAVGEQGTWRATTDTEGTVYDWTVAEEGGNLLPFDGGSSPSISFSPPRAGNYRVSVNTTVQPTVSSTISVLAAAPDTEPLERPENIAMISICNLNFKSASGDVYEINCEDEAPSLERYGFDKDHAMALMYEIWRTEQGLPKDFFSDGERELTAYIDLPYRNEEENRRETATYQITFVSTSTGRRVLIESTEAPIKDDAVLSKKEKRQAKRFRWRAGTALFDIDRIHKLEPDDASFPEGDPESYFEKNPNSELFLFLQLRKFWKTNKKVKEPRPLSEKYSLPENGNPNQRGVFKLTGTISGKGLKKSLYSTVTYASADPNPDSSIENPQPNFDRNDFLKYMVTDREDFIRDAREKDHSDVAGRTLGRIDGLEAVPEREKDAVVFAVVHYYQNQTIAQVDPSSPTYDYVPVPIANAKIDVVVPMLDSQDRKQDPYYTFHYTTVRAADGTEKTNVDVMRIGQAGVDFLDPNLPDIRRAPDFPANNDVKDLKIWIEGRYGAGALKLNEDKGDFDNVVVDLNEQLQEKSQDPDWFKTSYDLEILNDKAVANRHLTKIFIQALVLSTNDIQQRTQGIKSFTAKELQLLELSLETMPIFFLQEIASTSLIRQSEVLNNNMEEIEAITLGKNDTGTPRTICLSDTAFGPQDISFFGGKDGVNHPLTKTVTHEFGHVLHNQSADGPNDYLHFFESYVKEHNLEPPTEYGRQALLDGKSYKEFFADSFRYYQLDPEWLRNNHWMLFHWFDQLAKNAEPPN